MWHNQKFMSEPTRTVLIVDDEPQILRLVEKMIGPRRARVLMTPKPSEALKICEQQAVDVLISDLAMPEMDGLKLADRVLRLHPNAYVLLISGQYKEPAVVARSERIRFLKKPFFPSDLVRTLEEMLQ